MFRWLLKRVHLSFILVLFTMGVVVGVALEFVFNSWLFSSPLWLVVALVFLVFNFIKPLRAMFLLSIVAGMIVGGFRTNVELVDRAYISQFVGVEVSLSGHVYEDPDVDESKIVLRINRLVFGGEYEAGGSIYVRLSVREETRAVQRGDYVELDGKLSEGFGSFAGSMYRPRLVRILRPEPGDVARRARDGFAGAVKENIDEPEVDLALGYLLGARRSLPPDLNETLRIVGLTHIIVASGYNLTILTRFSRRMFGKVSRFAALFLSVLLVLGFAAVTGFSPSIMRAGLVSVLSLLAWYYGRKFHPVKLLLLAAAITLLINPSYVVDLGWLLSFTSFAGIMLVAPVMTAFFYGEKKPRAVPQVIIESLSAQLMCVPLIFYFFGSFSLVSIAANVLVLPTIPIVMALTFATGALVFLPVAALLGQLATWLLEYHLAVINFFGAQVSFLMTMPAENFLVFLMYVPIIGLMCWFRKVSKYSLRPVNVVE
jgi:competence protein ComEC